MSIKRINKILKEDHTGHKGYGLRVVNWLIPIQDLSKGMSLLKKDDGESLTKLIGFNSELRTTVLSIVLNVESFLTTRIKVTFKNTKAVNVEENCFRSEEAHNQFLDVLKNKYGKKSGDILLMDYITNITFGAKEQFIRLLTSDLISKIFYNDETFSKKEFLKIIRIIIETRNKFAHNAFVADPKYIENINIKPPKDYEGNYYDYYFKKLNSITKIYGGKRIDAAVKKLGKKYSKFLNLENL